LPEVMTMIFAMCFVSLVGIWVGCMKWLKCGGWSGVAEAECGA
jgi:hypothetical protein